LVALVTKATNVVPTPPAGKTYTLLDPVDASSTTIYQWCYAHVLAAADSGTSHTWAWTSARAACSALILRGVDTAQVLDVADPPAGTPANSTSVFAPASASVSPGAWVLWPSASASTTTFAYPATNNGNTVTREVGSVAGGHGLAWATYPTAGTVASVGVTLSVTGRCLAKTLIARPFVPGPVAGLSDDFNDNSLNTTRWGSTADAGTAVAETNQRLELALNAGGTGYCGIYSRVKYNLTGGQVLVECVDPGAATAGRTASLELQIDASNALKLVCDGPTLLIENRVGGSASYPGSVAFGAATRWWRIREAGGRVYYEYSASGLAGSWAALADVANPIAVTALEVRLYAGTYSALATPGVPKFDSLNVAPVVGPLTQRWTGSAWTPATVQRWSGSAWVPAQVKRWDGTGWV
jgi:hypothetical protein